MHHPVGPARDQVFLGQGLHPVGQGLEQAKRANPVRAVAVLHSPQALALEERGDSKESCERADDGRGGNQARHDRLPGRRRAPHHPLLQRNKNLVHCVILPISSKTPKPSRAMIAPSLLAGKRELRLKAEG